MLTQCQKEVIYEYILAFTGVVVHFLGGGVWWQTYFGLWCVLVHGGGWWWVVLDKLWLVMGGGRWWSMVVSRGGWWHSLV